MYHELRKHPLAYLVLAAVLIVFVIAFCFAWPDRFMQRLLILAMAVFYFLWGVTTHFRSAHISRSIILEYAAMAALSSVLLLFITW